MRLKTTSFVLILLGLLSLPASAHVYDTRAISAEPATAGKAIAPRLEGLGDYHFPITTNSAESRKFIDQGVRLTYAFNHSEALRAFKEAARLDPDNAMATRFNRAWAEATHKLTSSRF